MSESPLEPQAMTAILREDRQAVSPIVAEILLVAIAVVLAAVIFLMASGLLSSPGTNKPYVTFTPANIILGNASFDVAGVSLDVSYASFKFNLMVENETGSAAPMAASGTTVSMGVGGTTYRVTYMDAGGGGRFNMGDTIRVTGDGVPLPNNAHFTFYLIWTADGSVIQSVSFQP